jgi:ankyrin repeat protein
MTDTLLQQIFLLVQEGTNARDSNGNTALILAAELGNMHLVKALFECGTDINSRNHLGCDALDLAILNRHPSLIQPLIDIGIALNNPGASNDLCYSRIFHAVSIGDQHSVRILIKNGATLSSFDLSEAIYKGSLEIVHLLLEKGPTRMHPADSMSFLYSLRSDDVLGLAKKIPQY